MLRHARSEFPVICNLSGGCLQQECMYFSLLSVFRIVTDPSHCTGLCRSSGDVPGFLHVDGLGIMARPELRQVDD